MTDWLRRAHAVWLPGSATFVLFASMGAAQASILVLSPILPAVAADLGVTTAAASQLRLITGAVAGTVAAAMVVSPPRRDVRSLLLVGLGLLLTGTAASAVSPTFAVLAVAQAPIGVGIGLVLSSALAAAGHWDSQRRGRLLAWALAGQPAAWIVGMPVAGAIGGMNWRYAWVAVPGAASLVAILAVTNHRPTTSPIAVTNGGQDPDRSTRSRSHQPRQRVRGMSWRQAGVRAWALGEVLAYSAWSGVLIFTGALLIESYGISTATAGMALAAAAAAYVPGTFLTRRHLDRHVGPLLIGTGLASAVAAAALGGMRTGIGASTALLCVVALLAGSRTIAASALGLDLAPARPLETMSLRTACLQYGYLIGAAAGGTALALTGYHGLGITLGALYLLSTIAHATNRHHSPPTTAARPATSQPAGAT